MPDDTRTPPELDDSPARPCKMLQGWCVHRLRHGKRRRGRALEVASESIEVGKAYACDAFDQVGQKKGSSRVRRSQGSGGDLTISTRQIPVAFPSTPWRFIRSNRGQFLASICREGCSSTAARVDLGLQPPMRCTQWQLRASWSKEPTVPLQQAQPAGAPCPDRMLAPRECGSCRRT